jgi:hypothetical protein
MDTVLKFDRVVLTKELNDKIKRVGDIFEVANIRDNSFLLRETKSRVVVAVVSFEDFDEYFVPEENFKGWTRWTQFVGYDGQSDCLYRTNHKKVQIKFVKDKVRGEACCCKDDEFNLSFGIQLAYLRCLNKAMLKRSNELEEEMYRLNKEIYENLKIERKMINSLDV